MINDTVLYFHINPLKNEIFYVGIGNKKRPYSKRGRNSGWKEIVNQFGYVIDVVEEGLTWQEACERERFYIKRIGRKDLGLGPLVNLTDGGEGANGVKQTQEHKDKISEGCKGKKRGPMSEETKEKLRIINTGKKHSQETKDKLSKSKIGISIGIGRKLSQEHKNNISKGNKGRLVSKETIDKISKGNKGQKLSQETKDKIKNTLTGKYLTDEHKNNISESLLKHYKKKNDINQ